MDSIELFKKLRDVSNDIVVAMESNDEKEIESSLGRFLMLAIQMEAMR